MAIPVTSNCPIYKYCAYVVHRLQTNLSYIHEDFCGLLMIALAMPGLGYAYANHCFCPPETFAATAPNITSYFSIKGKKQPCRTRVCQLRSFLNYQLSTISLKTVKSNQKVVPTPTSLTR
jgi:hypothetical protein